jgi:hypothetical protein
VRPSGAQLGDLLRRAQADGEVREDLEVEDLGVLLCAAGSAVPVGGDRRRRCLGVILDGVRPEGASALSVPPRRPTPAG